MPSSPAVWSLRIPLIVAAATIILSLSARDARSADSIQESPPESPKLSAFAPVASLTSEANYYMERIEESLADEKRYSEASQSRVAKDAATVGILLTAIGLHDEMSDLQASAPRLVEVCEAIVDSSADYAKTKARFQELKSGVADGAEGGKPLGWEPRFHLELLMKQTTTVNNRLKRNTKKESSLSKRKDDAKGQAALLALIGQATIHDSAFVEDESKLGEWYRLSALMRDSAGAVGKCVENDDFAGVTENITVLQKSCDDCHEVFRVETNE